MSLSFCLTALFLLLLVYPFAIYPRLLRLLPHVPLPVPDPAYRPSAALLIAARDEAAVLPDVLARLARIKARWPALQILVHNDASRDGTAALLDAAADILTVRHAPVARGKAAALAGLVAHSRAEVLLLMDANTLPHDDAPERLLAWFADPRIGAVAAHLRPRGASGGALAARYWRAEERLKRLETATGSTIGCDGGLWAIRRALYPAMGAEESDDFRASLEPLLRGYRVISAPDARAEEIGDGDNAGWTRRVRIACGAWHADRAVAARLRGLSRLDRFKYISHKRLRWFSGLWLTGAAVSGGVWLAGLAPDLAAVALLLPPLALLIGPSWRLGASLVAVTAGIALAMLGGRQAAWAPARKLTR